MHFCLVSLTRSPTIYVQQQALTEERFMIWVYAVVGMSLQLRDTVQVIPHDLTMPARRNVIDTDYCKSRIQREESCNEKLTQRNRGKEIAAEDIFLVVQLRQCLIYAFAGCRLGLQNQGSLYLRCIKFLPFFFFVFLHMLS